LWKVIFVLLLIIVSIYYYPNFYKSTAKRIYRLFQRPRAAVGIIKWSNIDQGIESCSVTVNNPDTRFGTELFMLRVDPKFIETRVLYQKQLSTAQDIARSNSAFATINGSFFDEQNRPLGLLIIDGDQIQRMPTSGMRNSGIFCIKHDRPIIYHRDSYLSNNTIQAIQSMPRLIHRGRAIQKLRNKDERKRRSGIAIDSSGKIIIYITDTHLSGISFSDLQKFLLNPQLKIRSALNLDGGKSSQLYFKRFEHEKHIVGLTKVPVFLGFFKK